MEIKIEDLNVYLNDNNELCLSFGASSKLDLNASSMDLLNEVYKDLSTASNVDSTLVTDKEGNSRLLLDTHLSCRLEKRSDKIEFVDTASEGSSSLLLVPAILADAEVISEEEMRIIHAVISENTHVKKRGYSVQNQDDYEFLRSSAKKFFDR